MSQAAEGAGAVEFLAAVAATPPSFFPCRAARTTVGRLDEDDFGAA